ncbi:molybdopterin molybdenumtransferase MoeA [Hyphomicrobium methylovorum]|uniref:molybdopterin molybdotransferase MoeA n=1 Tax=Hyphomicrobium methylovorum TaxID=84 RepID=UPI0015E68C40|nr:gephyrin-like molybdotransferase Glp [Hyphomicrobium methylovorum]MBA2127682.1 molybdopterin molybdenumtransferase MoeA [Hyphomicrobium methylovorum]
MALLPVADALARVLETAETLATENVSLSSALGRTLAEPLAARLTNPPFDASAMDGYAVRASDVASVPVTLKVIGEAGAGRPFTGNVANGEAVRIFTGGALPEGLDTVVIQENTEASGNDITIQQTASRRENVRPKGEDFAVGRPLLERGHRVTARDILLAAAAGHGTLPVVRRPIVALLATGDELVEPGTTPSYGQIPASNSFGLAAVAEAAGAEARILGIARDSHASLAEALERAEGADVLVTIGGASVGDHDLVRPALEKSGAVLQFYKIAMRPGKPMFFGKRPKAATGNGDASSQICLGLPGNPVASLICARVFLVPLIGRLLGREVPLETISAVIATSLPPNGPREHYMRAKLDRTVSPPRATPFGNQDSGLVSSLQRADCLVVVPVNSPGMAAGSPITVLNLDI